MQQHRRDGEHSLNLRDEVHLALRRSPFFSSRSFDIELCGDSVVLKGIVRTYYQKQLAQESVRSVAGVQRVLNELEVCSI